MLSQKICLPNLHSHLLQLWATSLLVELISKGEAITRISWCRDSGGLKVCCLKCPFLSDQICHESPPSRFQCSAHGGECLVNFWQASVMWHILMSGWVIDEVGELEIFHRVWFTYIVTLSSSDLEYSQLKNKCPMDSSSLSQWRQVIGICTSHASG